MQAVQAVPQTQPSVVENAEHDESTVTARTVDLQPITMYQPVNESPSASQDSSRIDLANILTDPNTQPNETTQQSEDPHETQQPNEDTQQLTNDTEPEAEEVFDPQSIVRDIVEDDRTGRNLRLAEEYLQQETNLTGSVVNTSAGLLWTVCHDITASEVHEELDTLVGIKNFDFNNKQAEGD